MAEVSSKQAAQVNQWLELAPKPAPLGDQKKWHIFLSYRSVNRNWVLHLYDALRAAGFEVFLDQLQIAAGDSLTSRLNNALSESQSGVIVWSTEYKDSKWCQSEYESMEVLRKDGTFRFVIAKLDQVALPPFAKKDVYLDFSPYPNGPQGGELIKLMYGLLGQPLPDPVLRKAQAIDEATKRAISAINAASTNGNVKKLVALAKDGGEIWQASPLLYCAVAEALIEVEEYDRAIEVLQLATQFDRAVRPIQLAALAFARKAKLAQKRVDDATLAEDVRTAAREEADNLLSEAQQKLGELYELGHRDPETLGIYARTWMDRYALTGKRAFLEKSRNLYKLAFELDPSDYYTGINAATKSVLFGDLKLGRELAAQVEKLVGTVAVPNDYWKTATVAEVQLLQANYENAKSLYATAVADTPLATGNHSSSRLQAERILEALGAPEETRKALLAAFTV